MKKMLWVILPVAFLLLGCQKVGFNEGNNNNDKKFGAVSNGVKVPIKGSFMGMTTAINTDCVPGHRITKSMSISGNLAHLGELMPEKSWWTANFCELDTKTLLVKEIGNGVLVNEEGQSIFLHTVVWVDLMTRTFVGEIELTGGTGKFLNSTGNCKITNGIIYNDGTLSWQVDGFIVMAK